MSFNIEDYNKIDSVNYSKNDKALMKTINKLCNDFSLAEMEAFLESTIKEHKEAPVYRTDSHTLIKYDHCKHYAMIKLAIEVKTNQ